MNKCLLSAAIGLMISVTIPANAALPAISGTPEIETPQLLAWPTDKGDVQPNLNDPTANTLHDFHGELSSCDMVFSTEGNYYPALRDIWPVYLAKFNNDPLKNSFYTTSPPVFTQQAQNGMLQFGNLYATCRPQLAAGSLKAIKKLQDAGLTVGDPIPFYRDRGNVILVKKGNPKKIKSVWDLARADVHYASPNPTLEPGAFDNYVGTIYGIAENDAKRPKSMSPEALINAIFNNTRHVPHKWLAGARIHHRDVPWLVAYGKADAGVILYHLALYTQHAFPEQFDIVPLGGTIHDPQPLAGSVTGVRYLARVKGDWNSRQQQATDTLIETLLSEKFTNVLVSRGLARPDGFATAESGK